MGESNLRIVSMKNTHVRSMGNDSKSEKIVPQSNLKHHALDLKHLIGNQAHKLVPYQKDLWNLAKDDPRYDKTTRGFFVLNDSKWQQHLKGELCIIASPRRYKNNWVAVDIDYAVKQERILDMLDELSLYRGIEMLATPSTSKRGWHLWMFFAEDVSNSLLEHIARSICKHYRIRLDKVVPSHKGITCLFRHGHEVLQIRGEVKTPSDIPINSLAYVLITTPAYKTKASKNTKTSDARATTTKTSDARATTTKTSDARATTTKTKTWYDDIPQSVKDQLAKSSSLNAYIKKFLELYPKEQSYRQSYCLAAAADLLYMGTSEKDAENIIIHAAKQNQDPNLKERANAVSHTYRRKKQGWAIKGFKTKSSKLKICFYTQVNKLPPSQRKGVAERRIYTTLYHNTEKATKSIKISIRKLAELAGISTKGVQETLKKLEEKKAVKRQGGIVSVYPTFAKKLLIDIETREDATDEDLEVLEKRRATYAKERTEDNERKAAWLAQQDQTDSDAAPSDSEQTPIEIADGFEQDARV